MAKTASTMLALGTPAPDFALPDVVTGGTISLETFRGKTALLVMFICRHCPFVIHVQDELARVGRDYASTDLGIVAISANDASVHTEDAPASLREMAQNLGFTFPLCYDETQAVAKAFRAACTPDFYLFDAARRLVYRGQLDDARPGSDAPVTGRDLRAAIDATLAERAPDAAQRPGIGCNIKWKQGNAPEYFAT
ncbi:MAG: thioredoxin family protein [bacterium]